MSISLCVNLRPSVTKNNIKAALLNTVDLNLRANAGSVTSDFIRSVEGK